MFRIKSQYVAMYQEMAENDLHSREVISAFMQGVTAFTSSTTMVPDENSVPRPTNTMVCHHNSDFEIPAHRLEWIPRLEGTGMICNESTKLILGAK